MTSTSGSSALPELPLCIERLYKRPAEKLQARVDFDFSLAYLYGYDDGVEGSFLLGFREWGVMRIGYGSNRSTNVQASRLTVRKLGIEVAVHSEGFEALRQVDGDTVVRALIDVLREFKREVPTREKALALISDYEARESDFW